MILEKISGSFASGPEQTILKAGQLDLVYENGNIRWIKLCDSEILRMIYSAVRDRNWGTIEPIIEEEITEIKPDSFDIRVRIGYHADPIHFVANYHIFGENNQIRIEMNGTAQSDFLKNRIGFCVLHPIRECAGKSANVVHPDGSSCQFIFPEYISACQPVMNVSSLSWEPKLGIAATIDFSGDIFEMEDQRNWTDASFKTYCTPLELPFPAEIKKGETVSQCIDLKVETTQVQAEPLNECVFLWNPDQTYPLPEIGTAISSGKETLTQNEINLLSELPLRHLRVEIKLMEPNFRFILEKANRESQLLDWPLFVVLYLSDSFHEENQKFTKLCRDLKVNLSYVLLVGKNHLPFDQFDEFSNQFRADFPEVRLGTGVNAYFAELNRTQPSVEKADFVSFTISPQIHVFDNDSLVENLEAQAEVIKSARILYPQKPIFVSPVSLKQRFNVVATTPETETKPGTLSSSVDPRQRSVFAAQWTLGSLKFLAQAGAELVTYYETVGWKGLIQGEQKPANRNLFPADANEIFPVYRAMKEISGYSSVAHSVSSQPLKFDGLVVNSENKMKLFLFNFTSEDIEIRLEPAVLPEKIYSLTGAKYPEFSGEKLKLKAGDLVVIN